VGPNAGLNVCGTQPLSCYFGAFRHRNTGSWRNWPHICCLLHKQIRSTLLPPSSLHFTLKMEAARPPSPPETLVSCHTTTRRHNADHNLNLLRRVNLKCSMLHNQIFTHCSRHFKTMTSCYSSVSNYNKTSIRLFIVSKYYDLRQFE
jgi:hypothetical protein